jgi:hypothetical protein
VTENTYDPNKLLDFIGIAVNAKTDRALARSLGIAPSHLSKMRNRHLTIGAYMLIEMHELTGLSTKELRKIMGDRRRIYRVSDKGAAAAQRLKLAA